jgi:uracil-DNA glycosylase family 4
VETGKPFAGHSGTLLDNALAARGVDSSRVYKTNTVLCRPPNGDVPPPAAVTACFNRLVHEVQETMPRKVLALGGFAGKALTGQSSTIGQMRGQPAPSPHLSDCVLRVTYQPVALNRDPAMRAHFDADMDWFAEPDTKSRRRALVRELVDKGNSTAEIGQILGLHEGLVRRILQYESPSCE